MSKIIAFSHILSFVFFAECSRAMLSNVYENSFGLFTFMLLFYVCRGSQAMRHKKSFMTFQITFFSCLSRFGRVKRVSVTIRRVVMNACNVLIKRCYLKLLKVRLDAQTRAGKTLDVNR